METDTTTLDHITGYRTNHDGTQTLAWTEGPHGTVHCIHDSVTACVACVEADERLAFGPDGVPVVAYWPAYMIREGQTVRFDYSRTRI